MKLLIATLPFEGKVFAPTATSLLAEQAAAESHGVELAIMILSGAHYIAEGYNLVLKRFLETKADKLAFVEHDVSWSEPGALCKLAQVPHDYVGGSTRLKKPEEEYMVGWLPRSELWADQHGCIECAWIPQGFSVASREMVQAMWDAASGREFANHGEVTRQVFFEDWREPHGKLGQDIGFCADWRAMGGKVHVAPEIELTHTACHNHQYTGRLGDWLRKKMRKPSLGERLTGWLGGRHGT